MSSVGAREGGRVRIGRVPVRSVRTAAAREQPVAPRRRRSASRSPSSARRCHRLAVQNECAAAERRVLLRARDAADLLRGVIEPPFAHRSREEPDRDALDAPSPSPSAHNRHATY